MDPKSRLARCVRFIMRDVTYHKQYVCEVQSQDGMTVDLKPEDDKIAGAGLSAVPLRTGVPGFTFEVAQGARVLLAFDNGDPGKPFAALFDPGSIVSATFGEGSQAVARQGDLVKCGGTGTVATFFPIPPAAPGPLATGVGYLISFALPVAPKQAPLYGAIATGRLQLKA
jgi:hypothetical protein